MTMWLRLAGAVLVTLVALGLLDHWGAGADDLREAQPERPGHLFWMLLFTAVMATSVLAAARRRAQAMRSYLASSMKSAKRWKR